MLICKTIVTGSKGNSYALMNDNEILLLDLGVSAKTIKKEIDFRVSDIVGCLVTHSHSDHAEAVKDFENMGIPVFKPYMNYEPNYLRRNEMYVKLYKNFKVTSFQLPHNGTENCGYFIETDNQRVLYLTDFEYCPYIFRKQKVNHIICECNYQQDLVSRDLANYEHKIRGHCSLETCKSFIAANKTNALRTVILCHMGTETTIAEECLAEVQKVVGEGVSVLVAHKGLEAELKESGCPF